jgi:hypothetical protein
MASRELGQKGSRGDIPSQGERKPGGQGDGVRNVLRNPEMFGTSSPAFVGSETAEAGSSTRHATIETRGIARTVSERSPDSPGAPTAPPHKRMTVAEWRGAMNQWEAAAGTGAFSPEARAKIAEAQREHAAAGTGAHSPEARAKIAEAQRKHAAAGTGAFSPEARAKMAEAQRKPEARAKIAEAQRKHAAAGTGAHSPEARAKNAEAQRKHAAAGTGLYSPEAQAKRDATLQAKSAERKQRKEDEQRRKEEKAREATRNMANQAAGVQNRYAWMNAAGSSGSGQQG